MQWWQVQTIDFSLFLFALIVQRALVLALFTLAATYSDFDEIPMSLALDVTYAGIPCAVQSKTHHHSGMGFTWDGGDYSLS